MTKKALVIGINYPGTDSELRGCANDCRTSIEILKKYFGYKSKNIQFLTDAKEFPHYTLPTAENIRQGLKWLLTNATPGDHLFIHYSGHGSYVRDRDGDEKDGLDEVLCPCDYQTKGFITDDELFDTLKTIPEGVQVFSLMDCCHSGTMFDLMWSYNPKNKELSQTSNKNCAANIVMISGCRDDQTSADAFISGKYAGAMTTSFNKSLRRWFRVNEKDQPPSWAKLSQLMNRYVRKHRYSQRPQINCSHKLDLENNVDI